MQRKSDDLIESVTEKGKDFPEFMLPVNSPELKQLLARDKNSGHKARSSVQLDETIVKLCQEAFEIGIKTCTEDEWNEKISKKSGALKQCQSSIKARAEKEIENGIKAPLLFIALSMLLLIGIGLLPKSPVPVTIPGPIAELVSSSASPTAQRSTVNVTLSAKAP